MKNPSEKRSVKQEVVGKNPMTRVISKEHTKFEAEFNNWIIELEEQAESTRQSELLTQEDFAIQINAQG